MHDARAIWETGRQACLEEFIPAHPGMRFYDAADDLKALVQSDERFDDLIWASGFMAAVVDEIALGTGADEADPAIQALAHKTFMLLIGWVTTFRDLKGQYVIVVDDPETTPPWVGHLN